MSLRQDVGWVVGVAAFAVAVVASYVAWTARQDLDRLRADVDSLAAQDEESFAGLGERVEQLHLAIGGGDPEAMGGVLAEVQLLRRDVQEGNRRLRGVEEEERQLRAKVGELVLELEAAGKRIRELENRPVPPPVPQVTPEGQRPTIGGDGR